MSLQRTMRATRGLLVSCLLLVASLGMVDAHEHHDVDVGPYEHNFVNEEPLDSTIKWHIGIQVFCWGLLFPTGMILGITRSRFHVPLQTLGVVLSLCGNYLGHHHAGREFHTTAHSHMAGYLWWYLMSQTAMGVFLKLHVLEGTAVRRAVVKAHGIVGKSFPVFGWTQMIFGGIAALGFCFGEHVGQCAAHFIMGSAFIAYAVILALMMRVGATFLARRHMAQEYIDSWVIMLWGIVNTFTEHNFLAPHPTGWSHKDQQHVSLGVLWWAGGALGVWLSRGGKRSIVPAGIIAMTGYAMANHGQHLEFSTNIHKLFGWSLMAAGFCRVVEICFVLRDAPTPDLSDEEAEHAGDGPQRPKAFQHLTPFLLVLSGLTFLSATEEQMQWVAGSGMDSTTYGNILFSGAFAIYLVVTMMLDLYAFQSRHKSTASAVGLAPSDPDVEHSAPRPGGGLRLPGPVAAFVAPIVALVHRFEGTRDGDDTRGEARADAAPYESLPLRSSSVAGVHDDDAEGEGLELQESPRERSGTRGGGRGRSDGEARGSGSQETVFSLGDEVEDDGSDAFWAGQEKAERRGP
ncbi:putative membrane protein [Rhodotorula diobovata]|uniref:Putative membrane protein n=1 Tax=Rhodotorula diobovata TaxID=5288 RepID=A0A5C5G122_9BASI|nr:putative membrane protein [Rhodotorula diobovata]